jgi:hypothetical protein
MIGLKWRYIMKDYHELNKQEKTAYWQNHIASWKESGLSQTAYCRRNGINKNAFTWRRRSFANQTVPGMIRVSEKVVAVLQKQQKSLELKINNKLSIAISPDFNAELLTKLLKTLGVMGDDQLV